VLSEELGEWFDPALPCPPKPGQLDTLACLRIVKDHERPRLAERQGQLDVLPDSLDGVVAVDERKVDRSSLECLLQEGPGRRAVAVSDELADAGDRRQIDLLLRGTGVLSVVDADGPLEADLARQQQGSAPTRRTDLQVGGVRAPQLEKEAERRELVRILLLGESPFVRIAVLKMGQGVGAGFADDSTKPFELRSVGLHVLDRDDLAEHPAAPECLARSAVRSPSPGNGRACHVPGHLEGGPVSDRHCRFRLSRRSLANGL
jgi:hypothetical protein